MRASWTCAQLEDLAAELALGLVSGPERADALAHLADCASCRAEVERLAIVADWLALAGPLQEPPPGFESRVLDAIDVRPNRVKPSRFRLVAAAAVLIVILAVGTGWLGSRLGWTQGGSPARPTAVGAVVHQGEVRTPAGRVVGRVVLSHKPDAMVLSLRGWMPPDGNINDVHVKLTMVGGASRDLGLLPQSALDNGWAVTVPVNTQSIARVYMMDERGEVYCSATPV